MPKQSCSDTETVGSIPWDKLWEQSKPASLPTEKEMEKQGWRSLSNLMTFWEVCSSTARERCAKMLKDGRLEKTEAFLGQSNMRGVMFRPIIQVKKAKKS